MRRGQVTLIGLTLQELMGDHLYAIKKAGFDVPNYAINCVIAARPDVGSARMMFFDNSDDMLTQYTKFLLFRKKPDTIISYYSRENSDSPWIKSIPPTLVSAHIETKLR